MSRLSQRPKLPHASEEMRRAFTLIEQELLTWPLVTTRPMFGMKALYRDGVIFALLPGKRALERPKALGHKKAGKWRLLDLETEQDIDRALAHLSAAYEAVPGIAPARRRRAK